MKVYTVEQVAELLQVDPVTIRRHLHAGKIKGFKAGSLWRITEESLTRYMEERAN